MPGQRIGSIIAGVFGLVYVWVNTGLLPASVAWLLRVLGVLVFLAIVLAVWRSRGLPPAARQNATGGNPFGRGYWLVVVAEAVALFGGLRILAGPLDHPEGGVAWVSVVVGVHFLALAVVLHAPFFNRLGAAMTLCGVVGLVLVFAGGAQVAVAIVAGVVPGALLLGFGGWGALGLRPGRVRDQGTGAGQRRTR